MNLEFPWVSEIARGFPEMEISQARWMVYFMENPIQMDDLGVPPFQETPIYDHMSHTPVYKRATPHALSKSVASDLIQELVALHWLVIPL